MNIGTNFVLFFVTIWWHISYHSMPKSVLSFMLVWCAIIMLYNYISFLYIYKCIYPLLTSRLFLTLSFIITFYLNTDTIYSQLLCIKLFLCYYHTHFYSGNSLNCQAFYGLVLEVKHSEKLTYSDFFSFKQLRTYHQTL